MRPTVLGPVRHRCMACGAGCHGTDVLVADDERSQLEAIATELGVPDPFDGPHLRKERGRCVFLEDDARCAIHRRFGIEAKPLVCRQYPLVARQVGLEVRLGVDPGCLHAWRSWEDGPEVEDGTRIYRSRGGQPMAWNTEEQALVTLANPQNRGFAKVVGAMTGRGFEGRVAHRLVESQLGARIAHPGTAESLRVALSDVSAFLGDLDPDDPPAVRIPEALDRWTVEVIRRMVWLRLPARARPLERALGVVAGALACGWAHLEPEGYGIALGAWTRVIRTPVRSLLWPDDEAVAEVLRGH